MYDLIANTSMLSLGNNFSGRSAFISSIQFELTAAFTAPNNARLMCKNISASGTRGWGIQLATGGGLLRPCLRWAQSGSLIPTDGGSAFALTVGTRYHLMIWHLPDPALTGGSDALSRVRMFLNGVRVLDAGGLCLGASVTALPDDNSVAFTIGKDAQTGSNAAPLRFGEWEWSNTALPAADVQDLANTLGKGARFRRLQDAGIAVSNYLACYSTDAATIVDSIGGVTATPTSVSAPTSIVPTHFDQERPIVELIGDRGVFDAASGGSASTNNGAVARWQDQSGRALHARQSDAARVGAWRNNPARGDRFPDVWLSKHQTNPGGAAVGRWLDLPETARLDTRKSTIIMVVQTTGYRFDNASTNSDTGFSCLCAPDSADGGRVVVGRQGAATDKTGCFLRSEAANYDNGNGSNAAATAGLLMPASPTFVAIVHDAASRSATIIDPAVAAFTKTISSAAAATVGGAGSAIRIGSRYFDPGSGDRPFNTHGAHHGFRYFAFFNRVLDAGEIAAEYARLQSMGILPAAYTDVWMINGSSTPWGQAAAFGRGLAHYLAAQSPGSIVINCATPGTSFTSTNNHEQLADGVIDPFHAALPALPKHQLNGMGINDIHGGATGATVLTNITNYYADRATTFGAAARRKCHLFPWRTSQMDLAGELTALADVRAGLASASAGLEVIALPSSLLDLTAGPAAAFTPDQNHLNEDGFHELWNGSVRSALFPPANPSGSGGKRLLTIGGLG
jgi:hypothetical protein